MPLRFGISQKKGVMRPMSQKTKTITIRDKTFTLQELPVKAIWNLMNSKEENKAVNMFDQGRELLSLACPELTKDALLDLYPSEIRELWAGFEEVNADFLEVARAIGLDKAITEMIRGGLMSSTRLFASLLRRVTDQKRGSTVSGSFLQRLRLWPGNKWQIKTK